MKTVEQYDDCLANCPRLGHSVPFRYCRQEHEGKPCHRVFNCWGNLLPLREWLAKCFDCAELKYLNEPPPAKLSSIVDLINRAKMTQS